MSTRMNLFDVMCCCRHSPKIFQCILHALGFSILLDLTPVSSPKTCQKQMAVFHLNCERAAGFSSGRCAHGWGFLHSKRRWSTNDGGPGAAQATAPKKSYGARGKATLFLRGLAARDVDDAS